MPDRLHYFQAVELFEPIKGINKYHAVWLRLLREDLCGFQCHRIPHPSPLYLIQSYLHLPPQYRSYIGRHSLHCPFRSSSIPGGHDICPLLGPILSITCLYPFPSLHTQGMSSPLCAQAWSPAQRGELMPWGSGEGREEVGWKR